MWEAVTERGREERRGIRRRGLRDFLRVVSAYVRGMEKEREKKTEWT